MIKNAELQADIRGFIGQEAHHGYEHDAFNALMTHAGMPTLAIENLVKRFLDWYSQPR